MFNMIDHNTFNDICNNYCGIVTGHMILQMYVKNVKNYFCLKLIKKMVYVIIHIITVYPRSTIIVVRFGIFLSTVNVAPDDNKTSARILSSAAGLSALLYAIAITACSPFSKIVFGGLCAAIVQ